ncbi:MAG: hypothetical protein IJE05_06435 [Clostridia bacterium]|nr:hypothetical protein [Clostridia bacterium]
MANQETIQVLITFNRRETRQISIPYNINEVELKATLRDLGYISSYRHSYLTTKLYLEDNGDEKEIGTDEYRLLKDLNIKENSRIIIKPGDPEPQPVYRNPGSMRCLYGCPMAQSVEEAMFQAEKYSEKDSTVTTGFISDIDFNS